MTRPSHPVALGKRLQPGLFVRDGRAAARLAASRLDRVRLWAGRLASALRYRVPALVPSLTLYPHLVAGSRTVVAPVRLHSDDWLALHQVFFEPEYDWDLGRPTRILDLGANCGYSALWFASRFPTAEMAVVEPSPFHLPALRATLARNAIPARIFDAAVAAQPGTGFLEADGLSVSFRLLRADPRDGRRVHPVRMLTVDHVLDELGWPDVDLVKMDIEGSERALFAGSQPWLDRVGRIVGELHEGYRGPELRRDLEPRGFTCTVREQTRTSLFLAQCTRGPQVSPPRRPPW